MLGCIKPEVNQSSCLKKINNIKLIRIFAMVDDERFLTFPYIIRPFRFCKRIHFQAQS